MTDDLALADAFLAAQRSDWLLAVERVLKGADFEKRLIGRTTDGLPVQPIYEKADVPGPVQTGRGAAPWRVVARVDHPEPADANALLLAELQGGADAITIACPPAAGARGFGLSDASLDRLDAALDGVMLDLVSVRMDAGRAGRAAAALLVALALRRGHDLATLDLDLALDPIGAAAREGGLSAPWQVVGGRLAQSLTDLSARGFAGRLALADGRPYHEAGASEAQELACVVATALAYLRSLEAGGHSLETARAAISFMLVADADEFLTVAKFRALRRVWARVEEACGLAPAPIRVHAETSWRGTTRRDVWVNMLRGTLAAFSAGIGGADSICVLPFTAALGLPDGFARRVARNTQLILLEEGNLWRVSDPVAGSGAFEALTADLAAAAWTRVQELEQEGGIVASLEAGAIGARLADTRARRERAVATRRIPLVGVSEFPDLREKAAGALIPVEPRSDATPRGGASVPPDAFDAMVEAAGRGAGLHELLPHSSPSEPSFRPLPSTRLGEAFEAMRERSDAILAESGRRPTVFLANLGPVTAFSARSTFARNAFEACGVEAISNDGFPSTDGMVAAFRDAGTASACLCSSDEVYEAQAGAVAAELRAAGATRIYLAGRPGEREAEWRDAGVTDFLHVGTDLPATLGQELARTPDQAG